MREGKGLSDSVRRRLIVAQRNEITEHLFYERLSRSMKDPHNREVLKKISEEEKEHYEFWKSYTGKDVPPSKISLFKYRLIARVFGITFATRLMERGEAEATRMYEELTRAIPEAVRVLQEEDKHEEELVGLIDEERLRYMGSMVLGLSDALVELTGALAGFTFAFRDTTIIAMAGLITGIAASLSMGASEYLSTRTEGEGRSPGKASVYTTSAYVITVFLLILPFLLTEDMYVALALMVGIAILVIFTFTYYVSVAKALCFRRRFLEMLLISMGIAGISFLIGLFVRLVFNIDI